MINKTGNILALAGCLLALSGGGIASSQNASSLQSMSWLPGCWSGDHNGRLYEEHWTSIAAGSMFGLNRTIRNGKLSAFEFLQLREQDGSVVYTAQPEGKPGVPFKSARMTGAEAVFENAEHDFPQRIIYKKLDDGSLLARIEGTVKGQIKGIDFPMRRVKCD